MRMAMGTPLSLNQPKLVVSRKTTKTWAEYIVDGPNGVGATPDCGLIGHRFNNTVPKLDDVGPPTELQGTTSKQTAGGKRIALSALAREHWAPKGMCRLLDLGWDVMLPMSI